MLNTKYIIFVSHKIWRMQANFTHDQIILLFFWIFIKCKCLLGIYRELLYSYKFYFSLPNIKSYSDKSLPIAVPNLLWLDFGNDTTSAENKLTHAAATALKHFQNQCLFRKSEIKFFESIYAQLLGMMLLSHLIPSSQANVTHVSLSSNCQNLINIHNKITVELF